MDKIIVLIEACCQAYDNPKFLPNQPYAGVTYCNQAVQEIAEKMGYTGFAVSMVANEMIDFMRQSVAWKVIPLTTAQDQANLGNLVVLCQKDEPHGHVSVVRPGIAEPSGKWGMNAPMMCNIGSQNSLNKSANWIFPGNVVPDAFQLT